MPSIVCQPLGKKSFAEALELQRSLRAQRIAGAIPDTLLTVEHPPVVTQGRRPAEQDYRVSPKELRSRGFEIAEAGRGGKLTYHGPGQLVGYFIFSLPAHRLSIPAFVGRVEESVIRTLSDYHIPAKRREGCPGVWVEQRKIASIGLAIDRGVSMHGVALNIDPNLGHFDVIIPCGMVECEMTSMRCELGSAPEWGEVESVFQRKVREVFTANPPLIPQCPSS
jgi:lipoate-protein ligase B